MIYLNKIFLIGEVAGDVYVSSTRSGVKCASFMLLTRKKSDSYLENDSDVHNIACYANITNYVRDLKNGDVLFVEGAKRGDVGSSSVGGITAHKVVRIIGFRDQIDFNRKDRNYNPCASSENDYKKLEDDGYNK